MAASRSVTGLRPPKWARLECKSYKISEPEIEPLNGLDHDEIDGVDHDEELPIFLRSPETSES